MNTVQIRMLRAELARLEAERKDRLARGADVPQWFDHLIERRRQQLAAHIAPAEEADGYGAVQVSPFVKAAVAVTALIAWGYVLWSLAR